MECPGFSLTARENGKSMGGKDQAPIAFQALKMQASPVCHKNYVIFDQSDGQNTMILHPSWLQGPSHLNNSMGNGSMCMWEMNRLFDSLQVFKKKPMEAMFGFHSQAAPSPVFENSSHTRKKLSKMQESLLVDDTRCKTRNEKEPGLKTDTKNDSLSSEFHEDTEEINALLSSDDELSSTGHSPNEGALYRCCETMNGPSTNSSITMSKKRKVEWSAVDEVDDVDSRAFDQAVGTPPTFERLNSLQLPISSDKKSSRSIVNGCNAFCNTKRSRLCASGPAAICNEGQQSAKETLKMPAGGGLLNTPKRIKIKGNVQQLKNVIPGGKLLDTAGIIARTVQYVKCLQKKLTELEAAKESASMMHWIG